MRVKCVVSYDGTNFYGYQKQPLKRTVQGEIEKVLKLICKEDIIIHSSGRTDKGVHAVGQVFHFDTKIEGINFKDAINSRIVPSIKIMNYEYTTSNFHSRYDSVSKEYRYHVTYEQNVFTRNYKLYLKKELDLNLLKKATRELIGEHDFKNYSCVAEGKTIRTIYDIIVVKTKEGFYISFIGNGFLKYMIRILMGALIRIGNKKDKIEIINKNLNNEIENPHKHKIDACGLYLQKVVYK